MSFEPICSGSDSTECLDLRTLVGSMPLFQGLDAEVLGAICERMEWFALPGGTVLFEHGDAADALYVVVSGSLGVFVQGPEGTQRPIGRINAGESVGEMALISGKPRNATVIALRDSDLGRLSLEAFETLLRRHPSALWSIARLTVQRLESARTSAQAQRTPKTFAIVPHTATSGAATFAAQLTTQLERIGRTELVWNRRASEHTSQWFDRVERENEFVVYVCDPTPTPWSKLCVRQADVLVLFARSDEALSEWPILLRTPQRPFSPPRCELILWHTGVAPVLQDWLQRAPAATLHHVRSTSDIARLARWFTGRGLGVVLSGGGARGLAHIGVLRALRESGVQIDAIGGTSIGAIIAAGFASQWDHDEIVMRVRRSFVATNPLNDYTLPWLSLLSGRKVSALLKREFGDNTIEDLSLPFFCVSCNLSSGQLVTHRRGSLWRWLRASVSIPGVLPPVAHERELYIDGATINNLPTDVMREFGAGRVIGVDVGVDRAFTTELSDLESPPLWRLRQWFRGRERRLNILQVLWRASMINSAATRAARRQASDLLLQPPLTDVDMLDWQAFERAVEIGYRSTLERLEQQPLA